MTMDFDLPLGGLRAAGLLAGEPEGRPREADEPVARVPGLLLDGRLVRDGGDLRWAMGLLSLGTD